jgi:hypothetical protein
MMPYRGGRAAWSEGWGQSDDSQCWLCNYSEYSIHIIDDFLTIQIPVIFKIGHGRFAIH